MERTCPNCKGKEDVLGDYFCLNCGQKLPDEFVLVDVRSAKLNTNPPPFIVKTGLLWPKKLTPVLAGVLVFAVFLIIVPRLLKVLQTSKSQPSKLLTVSYGDREVKAGLQMPDFPISASPLASFTPSVVGTYVEGASLKDFISTFFESTKMTADQKALIYMLGKDSNGPFAVFYDPKEATSSEKFGLIAKMQSTDDVQNSSDLLKRLSLSVGIMDNYVVMVNDSSLLTDIAAAKNKTALSLSLNSRFAVAKNALPKSAKLYVFMFSDSANNDLKKLSGLQFVTSKFGSLVTTMVSKDKDGYAVE